MAQHLRKSIKPIMIFIVIIFAVSCFFMYGTGGGRNTDAAAEGDGAGKDHDVAIVDGERIKLSRLETEMARMISGAGLGGSVTSRDYPALRNNVIDQIATLKELDKEIVSRKITSAREEVDEEVSELESQFPTKEIYLQNIQAIGLTEAEVRKSVEENIRRRKLLEGVTGVTSTDAAEVRGYYDIIKSYAFQRPDGFTMDVAHFSAGKAAEAARKSLASGKKWDDVIKAASPDVFYSDRKMFAPAEQFTGDVAFLKTLPMNVPSKVVSLTSDDYMVVVKRNKEAARMLTFDEVSLDVEQALLEQKRSSLQSQFMQELRARAKVEILDEALFNVALPGAAAAASGDKPASAPSNSNNAEETFERARPSQGANGAEKQLASGDKPKP